MNIIPSSTQYRYFLTSFKLLLALVEDVPKEEEEEFELDQYSQEDNDDSDSGGNDMVANSGLEDDEEEVNLVERKSR